MKTKRAHTAKLVVLIDDDPMVLESTGGLLRRWGCTVVAAESYGEAMKALAKTGGRPDLIVCDYRLSHGATGVDAIKNLREAFEIPALLISGDVNSPASEVSPGGYHLLHKPVNAEAFRTALAGPSLL